MSGPKRNPDRLNTIGVVVVGICGAVLVYVTIVVLGAFYVNDTSELQTMADYGGQDTVARSLRSDQMNRITEYGTNAKPADPKGNQPAQPQTFRIPIDLAMKLVIDGAKQDPSSLVPTVGRSDQATVRPIFGRPALTPPPGAAPAAPAPAAPPAGAPAPGGDAAGSAAVAPSAPMAPTGAGTGPAPVGGAGALDRPATPGTPGNPTGGAPPPVNPPANPAGAPAAPPATPPAKGNAN